jgi:hypothetical protein
MFNKFFFLENRAVCEIMWKNMVQRGRPRRTIWRMRIACWITKATHIDSEYVLLIPFPLYQWLQESASMFGYTYIASHSECYSTLSSSIYKLLLRSFLVSFCKMNSNPNLFLFFRFSLVYIIFFFILNSHLHVHHSPLSYPCANTLLSDVISSLSP